MSHPSWLRTMMAAPLCCTSRTDEVCGAVDSLRERCFLVSAASLKAVPRPLRTWRENKTSPSGLIDGSEGPSFSCPQTQQALGKNITSVQQGKGKSVASVWRGKGNFCEGCPMLKSITLKSLPWK